MDFGASTYAEKAPRAKVLGEKCGENLAKNFADVRPSISRKIGRKKFHEKSSANSTSHEIRFFHRETPGACWLGAQPLKLQNENRTMHLLGTHNRICTALFE